MLFTILSQFIVPRKAEIGDKKKKRPIFALKSGSSQGLQQAVIDLNLLFVSDMFPQYPPGGILREHIRRLQPFSLDEIEGCEIVYVCCQHLKELFLHIRNWYQYVP